MTEEGAVRPQPRSPPRSGTRSIHTGPASLMPFAHRWVCVPFDLPAADVEYRLAVRLLAQDPPLDRQIIEALVGAPRRYRDLKALLQGRRDHVLTKALARLRSDGVVKQGVVLDAGNERVYALTELGKLVVFRLHEMVPHAESIAAYERGRAARP